MAVRCWQRVAANLQVSPAEFLPCLPQCAERIQQWAWEPKTGVRPTAMESRLENFFFLFFLLSSLRLSQKHQPQPFWEPLLRSSATLRRGGDQGEQGFPIGAWRNFILSSFHLSSDSCC